MRTIYYVQSYSSVDYRPCSILGYFETHASALNLAMSGGNYNDDPKFPLRQVRSCLLFTNRHDYDVWLDEELRRSALQKLTEEEQRALGLKGEEG